MNKKIKSIVLLLLAVCMPVFRVNAYEAEKNIKKVFSFQGDNFILWTDSSGSINDTGASFTFSAAPAQNSAVSSFDVSAGTRYFSASHSMLDVRSVSASGSIAADFSDAGFSLYGGIFKHGNASITFNDITVKNNEGTIWALAAEIPVKIRSVTITPFGAFMSASWQAEKGDLWYLNGKPDIPYAWTAGIYGAEQTGCHVSAAAGSLLADGYTDSSVVFASAPVHGADISGGKEFLFGNSFCSRLDIHAGYSYAGAQADVLLTSETQQYSLFPYTVFEINGNGHVHAARLGASAEIGGKTFSLTALAGAAVIIDGIFSSETYSKKKSNFGGAELTETDNISLAGLGCAYFSFESRCSIKSTVSIEGALQKTIVLPFNLNSSQEDSVSTAVSSIIAESQNIDIVTILLSGLGISLTLSF